LPDGKPKPCARYPSQLFTKVHSIHCLNMHTRLQIPCTITGPLVLSFERITYS
ncbi:hypothetical protein BCV71DRAFT_189627, partial [Rhizopus microsporus]